MIVFIYKTTYIWNTYSNFIYKFGTLNVCLYSNFIKIYIVRMIGPVVCVYIYIYIYILGWGPVWGLLVIRGWVNVAIKVRISE